MQPRQCRPRRWRQSRTPRDGGAVFERLMLRPCQQRHPGRRTAQRRIFSLSDGNDIAQAAGASRLAALDHAFYVGCDRRIENDCRLAPRLHPGKRHAAKDQTRKCENHTRPTMPHQQGCQRERDTDGDGDPERWGDKTQKPDCRTGTNRNRHEQEAVPMIALFFNRGGNEPFRPE